MSSTSSSRRSLSSFSSWMRISSVSYTPLERGAGLSLALDPLRAAIWDLAAAALDHTGRRLAGRRDRPVPSELRLCWPYRRLRPCLAAAGGGVVHPGHGVPPADGRQVFLPPGGVGSAPWKCGKRPLCRWKTHSRPDGKAAAFPTARKHRFPQHRPAWPFAHNPTAPTTAAAAKIAFPDRKNHHFMVEWG